MHSMIEQVHNLPDSPGIYFFKKGNKILYIGKATSLRDRVRSYFASDLIAVRSPLILKMIQEADSVEHQSTDSVLEALILEANLIKKHQPKYNTLEKDDKSFNYVAITKENFPRVLIIRGKELAAPRSPIAAVFGPFPHGLQLKEALKIVRKIFPFRDTCVPFSNLEPRTYNLEPAPRPCFNAQIGLCPGVCVGAISKIEYAKTIRHIKLFFAGKKSELMRTLEREMRAFAKKHEFEKANELKRQIFALQHIQDVALLKSDNLEPRTYNLQPSFRIEAYDVAHISGTSTVGVMTVLENGELKKSDYRKFRIRGTKFGSDTDALREILERRLRHEEWKFPDLIVIDGGVAQKNTAEKVIGELQLKIPVVSVVKDAKHRPDHFLGDQVLVSKYKSDIILANAEAHRFAIQYHRKVRGRFLGS